MKKFLSKYWLYLGVFVFAAVIFVVRVVFMITPATVETGSMVPTLPVHSVVWVQPTDTLKPQDIITFRQDTDAHSTTHTFIGYADDGSLITKGDANPVADVRTVPLQMSDVEGKVVWVTAFPAPSFWESFRGMMVFVIIVIAAIGIAAAQLKYKKDLLKEKQIQQAKNLASTPV